MRKQNAATRVLAIAPASRSNRASGRRSLSPRDFPLLAMALAIHLAPMRTQADIIYRETFGIAPGATVDSLATVFDWQRFDNNGAEITTTGSSSGVNYTVNGRPIDVSNVNAGPNNDGTFGPYANGIPYLGATPSPSLAFTPEFTVNPANYVPGSIVFSWYEGNNTAPHTFPLLVRNFDTSGNLSLTNTISPGVPQQFFRLQSP